MLTLSLLSALFLRKNEQFLFQNASSLTHDNFNKKNFVKIVIQNSFVKRDALSGEMIHFYLKIKC